MEKIIAAFLMLVVLVTSAHAQEGGNFTITAAPAGAAPKNVRDGWIGLTLPFDEIGFCSIDIYGDLLKTPTELSYRVPQKVALDLLKIHSPEAFKWWNDNGLPVSSVAVFCFSAEPLVG